MLNVEIDVVSIYYLHIKSKVVAIVGENKLLLRLMMEGKCVGNVVGAKEMTVYVCWGDIGGWDEWDDEVCEWEYEMCLDVTRYESRRCIEVGRAGYVGECKGVKVVVYEV